MSQASYAHGAVGTPLRGETIGAALATAVARYGEREAVVSCHQGVRLSYRELGAAVERCALALLEAGVAIGDRVGIWAPNCVEWVVVQYATARVGAILVTVNPAYRQHELDYVLNQAGVSVLVYASEYRGGAFRPLVEAADARDLRLAIELGGEWDAFLLRAAETDPGELAARAAQLTFDQAINIQYTSGTTDAPTRRPGLRRAARALRRGALRVDRDRGRCGHRPRRGAEVLRGADRPLQDSALRARRRTRFR